MTERFGMEKGDAWKQNEYEEFKPSNVPKFLGPVVVLMSCAKAQLGLKVSFLERRQGD